jgi:DNA-binding MarR family transcriptional regulator
LRDVFPIAIGFWYDANPRRSSSRLPMPKTRTPRPRRDLPSLLYVPQHDLQTELDARLDKLGFPVLRHAHNQLLARIGPEGVRLPDLVATLGLPKQTVGDLVDDLESMKMVERVPDPDHGVIKRVRLGPKGRLWAAEVKKATAVSETRWTRQLGKGKMKSLRALLEQLAQTVEQSNGVPATSTATTPAPAAAPKAARRRRSS